MTQLDSRHHVGRQLLVVSAASDRVERGCSAVLDQMNRTSLRDVLERVLDAMDRPDLLVQIGELSIDLGIVAEDDLHTLPARYETALQRAIARALGEGGAQSSDDLQVSAAEVRSLTAFSIDGLTHYLTTGIWPERGLLPDTRSPDPSTMIDTLLLEAPDSLLKALAIAARTASAGVGSRLAQQLTTAQLGRLIEQLEGPDGRLQRGWRISRFANDPSVLAAELVAMLLRGDVRQPGDAGDSSPTPLGMASKPSQNTRLEELGRDTNGFNDQEGDLALEAGLETAALDPAPPSPIGQSAKRLNTAVAGTAIAALDRGRPAAGANDVSDPVPVETVPRARLARGDSQPDLPPAFPGPAASIVGPEHNSTADTGEGDAPARVSSGARPSKEVRDAAVGHLSSGLAVFSGEMPREVGAPSSEPDRGRPVADHDTHSAQTTKSGRDPEHGQDFGGERYMGPRSDAVFVARSSGEAALDNGVGPPPDDGAATHAHSDTAGTAAPKSMRPNGAMADGRATPTTKRRHEYGEAFHNGESSESSPAHPGRAGFGSANPPPNEEAHGFGNATIQLDRSTIEILDRYWALERFVAWLKAPDLEGSGEDLVRRVLGFPPEWRRRRLLGVEALHPTDASKALQRLSDALIAELLTALLPTGARELRLALVPEGAATSFNRPVAIAIATGLICGTSIDLVAPSAAPHPIPLGEVWGLGEGDMRHGKKDAGARHRLLRALARLSSRKIAEALFGHVEPAGSDDAPLVKRYALEAQVLLRRLLTHSVGLDASGWRSLVSPLLRPEVLPALAQHLDERLLMDLASDLGPRTEDHLQPSNMSVFWLTLPESLNDVGLQALVLRVLEKALRSRTRSRDQAGDTAGVATTKPEFAPSLSGPRRAHTGAEAGTRPARNRTSSPMPINVHVNRVARLGKAFAVGGANGEYDLVHRLLARPSRRTSFAIHGRDSLALELAATARPALARLLISAFHRLDETAPKKSLWADADVALRTALLEAAAVQGLSSGQSFERFLAALGGATPSGSSPEAASSADSEHVKRSDETSPDDYVDGVRLRADSGVSPPDRPVRTGEREAWIERAAALAFSQGEESLSRAFRRPRSLDDAQPRQPATVARPTLLPGSERLRVDNAGIVLAAPYLPMLFDRLGLMEDDGVGGMRFATRGAMGRGLHFLQVLADGSTDTPEPALILNKVLVGMHPSFPAPRRIKASELELELCEGLLFGMLANWSTLSGTSPAGLREGFLQRTGWLRHDGALWQLEVERKTLDILLDQLPWGFSMIAHPWMETPLSVSW